MRGGATTATLVIAAWAAWAGTAALVACSRPAAPGYGKARFGMTPEEALQAYGLARAEVKEDLYGEKLEWFLPARVGDGEAVNLTFFTEPGRRRFELCCVNATRQGSLDETLARLTSLYGQPMAVRRSADGGEAVWRREGITVEVSAIGGSVLIRVERPRGQTARGSGS